MKVTFKRKNLFRTRNRALRKESFIRSVSFTSPYTKRSTKPLRSRRPSLPHVPIAPKYIYQLTQEQKEFLTFFSNYTRDKIFLFSGFFEENKNTVVKSVLIKRGKRNRMFLHTSAMALLTLGIVISPFVSDSNLMGEDRSDFAYAQALSSETSIAPEDVFQTQASEKPRDEIIQYRVQKGDTISTIAKKFDISEDTIEWTNDLESNDITVGETLDILPVTGIAHKVSRGDTVYTIAKKYDTNPQQIVDFPFNDFANPQTFSLVEGSIIVVPNGVEPQEQPRYVRPSYVASGPTVVTETGFTWPVRGSINQPFSWYHRAVDLGASLGTPILAAQSGTVAAAYAGGWNGGYGTYVIIQGDNGYRTLYAHMSSLNVSTGQKVNAGGTTIGWIGMTGRTTGPHVHFEIRSASDMFNPLSFLR